MRVGIALGSNLGDRHAHLQQAVDSLRELATPGESFLVSRIYETDPVDCPPGSSTFLNAAIEIDWTLTALDLLRNLQELEREAGRPSVRDVNSPRPLDLDILYFGDQIVDSLDLVIPHPRLTSRLFVLAPLADIIPARILPGQASTVAQLLACLKESETNMPLYIANECDRTNVT